MLAKSECSINRKEKLCEDLVRFHKYKNIQRSGNKFNNARPHMTLKSKTPSEAAGIKVHFSIY